MFTIAKLLLFCFAVIGFTNIIVDPATIMQPVRDLIERRGPSWLNKLVSCYQCTGTWVGFFCGTILFTQNIFESFYVFVCNAVLIFICGMAGSFVATLAAQYLNYLQALTDSLDVSLDDEDEDE